MNALVRGSIAGVVATIPMTAVIAAGRLAGLIQTPPPKQITANAERDAGVHPSSMSRESFHASWLAAHLGFGAAAGAVFALIGRFLPGSERSEGLLYGLLVWATNYIGLLPSLGLYPGPTEDSTSRTVVMIVAHGVYGVALAETEDRLPGG